MAYVEPDRKRYHAQTQTTPWSAQTIVVDKNIIVETTIKYTGSDNYMVTAPYLFEPTINIISPDGTLYDEMSLVTVQTKVEVYPQLSKSRQFVFGPITVSGMYRVEVSHLVYNPDNSQVDITVGLLIEVKP